jgi:ABC-type transport system involved in cytochrome c biogenesis permease subunit
MWALAGREPAEPASFGRLWLTLHLVPVYLGYAGFAVAAGAGAAYLVQERLLRRKRAGTPWRLLPSLETLQRVEWAALSLGYPVFTVGLVAGVLWVYQAGSPLGGAWYADPKVLGGAAVWLFYTAVLHLRLFLRLRGRRAAWLTLAGFLFTLLSFGTAHLYGGDGPAEGARAPQAAPKAGP